MPIMRASSLFNPSLSAASKSSWPTLSSTCMSKAVLTAYRWSPLSFRMRSRSSMPSRASSSLDLVVTMSCGLTLIDLSHHCPIILLQTLEVWLCQWPSLTGIEHYLPHTEMYTQPHVLKDRWPEERTGSSFLNFFQAVFMCCG